MDATEDRGRHPSDVRRDRALVGLASLAFVSLGLPDGLLGVAWPSMRAELGLPLDAVGALLASFTAGYVSASFAGGRLLARLGLGALLTASCLLTGASLLGYALAASFAVIVACGLVAGLGAGGIDTGINTYAAERHGPGMLNWLHACYGVGAAGGPAIMTAVLAARLPWQRGYVVVAVAQLMLAAAFAARLRAWSRAAPARTAADAASPGAPLRATFRLRSARLGIAIFFVYTGLELATGTWAYTLLTEGRGLAPTTAGPWITCYWVGLTTGRVLGALALRTHPVATVLRATTTMLAASLAVFALPPFGGAGLLALVVAGAAAGPIFPSLIATTPLRVGSRHAANTIGVQIAAAALGQTVVPAALGVLGRRGGLGALGTALPILALVVLAILTAMQRAVRQRRSR